MILRENHACITSCTGQHTVRATTYTANRSRESLDQPGGSIEGSMLLSYVTDYTPSHCYNLSLLIRSKFINTLWDTVGHHLNCPGFTGNYTCSIAAYILVSLTLHRCTCTYVQSSIVLSFGRRHKFN